MAKNTNKRPTTNAGRPSGPSTGGTPGGGGDIRTTTDTVNDVQWNRRKAWPLLLGSAAVLGGASAVNYAWANPDGKLTSKAQSELSAKYPGATVRVHGRDAIITGLPPGADTQAAHDLVRHLEGIRSVREQAGSATVGATDTTADNAVATEAAASEAAPAVATDTVAASEAAPAVATDTVAASEAVATVASTTAVATTVAPSSAAPTTAAPTTAAPTTAAPITEALATAAPTTEVASTDAPTTTIAAPATSDAPSPTTAPPPVKILFDTTSSSLAGESSAGVDQLAAYLQGNPDVRIKVVGHADNYGTRLTNLAISRARADAVVSALVTAGIDRSRLSTAGQGDRLPAESNATKAGRRANRRVEIVYFGAEGAAGREVAFTG